MLRKALDFARSNSDRQALCTIVWPFQRANWIDNYSTR